MGASLDTLMELAIGVRCVLIAVGARVCLAGVTLFPMILVRYRLQVISGVNRALEPAGKSSHFLRLFFCILGFLLQGDDVDNSDVVNQEIEVIVLFPKRDHLQQFGF